MKRIPVVMLAAAGAVSTFAFADTVYYYVPPTVTYVEPAPTVTYIEPAPTVTYVEPAPIATQPSIIVTAPRDADEDYLINSGVADTIASDPSIHGHVETQAYRNTVTLGGRVTTPGMVDRVERDAKSVDGVRDVENFVRPVVGGS